MMVMLRWSAFTNQLLFSHKIEWWSQSEERDRLLIEVALSFVCVMCVFLCSFDVGEALEWGQRVELLFHTPSARCISTATPSRNKWWCLLAMPARFPSATKRSAAFACFGQSPGSFCCCCSLFVFCLRSRSCALWWMSWKKKSVSECTLIASWNPAFSSMNPLTLKAKVTLYW